MGLSPRLPSRATRIALSVLYIALIGPVAWSARRLFPAWADRPDGRKATYWRYMDGKTGKSARNER